MRLNNGYGGIIVGLVITALTLVSSVAHSQNEPPAFQLVILKENWFDLELGYDPDAAFERLRTADYTAPVFVLMLDDLESYRWDWQMLTLTKTATQRLAESLSSLNHQEDIQKLMDLEANLGWGNPLAQALYLQPFVVQTEGRFTYGGIFLDAISQMAINYPVIRVEVVEGQAVFHILPTHIPFVNYDPVLRESVPLDDAFTTIIEGDRNDAPEFFEGVVNNWASSDTPNHFREIIRSESIRALVEASGKLKTEDE